MSTTNNNRTRGRPRRFDADEGVTIAQGLFHARGYDAVSVGDVTEALGINPPSFYAAFGNKAGLYARVLNRYASTAGIPLSEILRDDLPVAQCLTSLLAEAARLYAAKPETAGCLVLEGTRSNDEEARAAACVFHVAAEDVIRTYIAARHPEKAESLTDFLNTTMMGLSAQARRGIGVSRLMEIARLAGQGVVKELSV